MTNKKEIVIKGTSALLILCTAYTIAIFANILGYTLLLSGSTKYLSGWLSNQSAGFLTLVGFLILLICGVVQVVLKVRYAND